VRACRRAGGRVGGRTGERACTGICVRARVRECMGACLHICVLERESMCLVILKIGCVKVCAHVHERVFSCSCVVSAACGPAAALVFTHGRIGPMAFIN